MSFSNRYYFWFTWIFLIALLSGINNYYFYSHVERTAKRDAQQIQAIIEVEQKCHDSKKSCEEHIIEIAKTFAKKAENNYNTSFKIINANQQIIWENTPEKKLRDTVAGSDIQLILLNDHLPKLQFSTYLGKQAFLYSIVKSMTFSITDIFSITYTEGLEKAIEEFKTTYWKRSRPAIGFAIFSFLILWIYKKREKQLISMQAKQDESMIIKFKEEIDESSSKVEEDHLIAKFYQYDHIINPPINTLVFKNLIEIDTEGIGNKFRKVLEKIFFPIVIKTLKTEPKDLKNAIHLLYDNRIISSNAQIYATLIRIYGNMDSHYNENSEITKEEIRVLAFRLLSIIDEIIEKNLLEQNVTDHTSNI